MKIAVVFVYGIISFITTVNPTLLLEKQHHLPAKTVNVTTDCGVVIGLVNQSYVFRGIPYALPPTGCRRWKEPVPMSKTSGNCWEGAKEAFEFGSPCTQQSVEDPSKITGSEDCLYLNVWTPSIDAKTNLPVMVFIHGGSLQVSNGNWPTYSPTQELANHTNVVYVSMNYRLNAFGFMALDILSEASPTKTSGNYGFMDQIAALKWVQTNIRNFGGDPNQVTVFGQSSGGTSIFALLASPMSPGLFSKAWMLSASPILNKTTDDASRDNLVFLENTGCTNVNCLYQLPPKKILDSVPWNVYPYWAMLDQTDLPTKGYFDGAIAVVDGYFLPDPPLIAWKKGNAVDVPLMIGTTAQETDYNPIISGLKTWSWSSYTDHVTERLTTFNLTTAQKVLKFYPPEVITPEYQFTSMVSDLRVNCPNDKMATLASEYLKSPVYRYVVTSEPSKPIHPVGMPFAAAYSFHMWDCFAFFGSIKNYIHPLSESDLKFQNNVQTEMLSFVKTGRPSSPTWGTFDTSTMLLSDTLIVEKRYHEYECEYFTDNFWSYAWIN